MPGLKTRETGRDQTYWTSACVIVVVQWRHWWLLQRAGHCKRSNKRESVAERLILKSCVQHHVMLIFDVYGGSVVAIYRKYLVNRVCSKLTWKKNRFWVAQWECVVTWRLKMNIKKVPAQNWNTNCQIKANHRAQTLSENVMIQWCFKRPNYQFCTHGHTFPIWNKEHLSIFGYEEAN